MLHTNVIKLADAFLISSANKRILAKLATNPRYFILQITKKDDFFSNKIFNK
jgi:hypothetical protein